ncbi:hypothetical protein H2248_003854 [Termitomyces sp. 'cryptogamus']|nr:hypothetical protein H2248_003854 [Termitomyces sp. 'cryptogamus']
MGPSISGHSPLGTLFSTPVDIFLSSSTPLLYNYTPQWRPQLTPLMPRARCTKPPTTSRLDHTLSWVTSAKAALLQCTRTIMKWARQYPHPRTGGLDEFVLRSFLRQLGMFLLLKVADFGLARSLQNKHSGALCTLFARFSLTSPYPT